MKFWDKNEFTEPVPSFGSNTHKRYILRHCVNIVVILQNNLFNAATFTF